jgi:Rv0078B-related antitoxin
MADFTAIRITDFNYSIGVHLERARLKREHPDQSDAEIDRVIFSAILDLMGDPTWEGVQ